MENLMMVYGKPATDERYEELNLWYTWEHIGDELMNRACLVVQRFELSRYQPRNADTNFPVLCLYEVVDRDYCIRWHLKDARTWRMKISTALSREFYETFWNPVCKTSDWAEYADYRGEKAVLTIKLKAKPGKMEPKDYFTKEKLKELRCLPGFQALHLFDWHPEHQMPTTPPPLRNTVITTWCARSPIATWWPMNGTSIWTHTRRSRKTSNCSRQSLNP